MGALSGYALPTTEEEVWRYSRIAELDLDAYTPAGADAAASATVPPALEGALAAVPVRGVTIVVVNGRVIDVDVQVPGVDVTTDDRTALGRAMTEATDVFATMNDVFVVDPIVVRVARGANVEAPIVVANWTDTADIATFPRLVVIAGDDSQAEVVDYHASADGVPMFTAPVTELCVG